MIAYAHMGALAAPLRPAARVLAVRAPLASAPTVVARPAAPPPPRPPGVLADHDVARAAAPTVVSRPARSPPPRGPSFVPGGPTGIGTSSGASAPSVPSATSSPAVPAFDASAPSFDPVTVTSAAPSSDAAPPIAGGSVAPRGGSVSVSASVPDGAVYLVIGLTVLGIGGAVAWFATRKKRGRR